MSATGRGAVREENDNYSTPDWAIRRLLEAGVFPNPQALGTGWLDPCAGDGQIIQVVQGTLERRPTFTAVEIRESCRPDLERVVGAGSYTIADFREWSQNHVRRMKRKEAGPFEVAITNPPFDAAMSIINACMAVAKTTVLLLRVNFLATGERALFMHQHCPDVYVLPDRPPFKLVPVHPKGPDGKPDKSAAPIAWRPGTDATEYAWFVWRGQKVRRTGEVRVLMPTPREEKQAWVRELYRRQGAQAESA